MENRTFWHRMKVNKSHRAKRWGQKPALIWFTGLSGSGKSTTAALLDQKLFSMGYSTYVLDGDNIRHGLCSDLGFSDKDRTENIRRVGEAAKLMVDAGLIVIASFISPFRQDRELVRGMLQEGEFIECFVDAALETCELRDPKGLYKNARAGLIERFTGVSSPYEPPTNPDLRLNTEVFLPEQVVEQVVSHLVHIRLIDEACHIHISQDGAKVNMFARKPDVVSE